MAAQNVQDHVIHFYHLHALDWVDIVSALKADPAKTAVLAQSISDWPLSSVKYFTDVLIRVKAFVERGQLGIFANAYWGHPAYRLPPEANLLGLAHYLEALDWQRRFIKIHAILGGKNPHLQSFLVGGMATPVDPDSQNSLNMDTIAALDKLVADGVAFVTQVYLPDVLAIASFYKDWASIGTGIGNYMSYGEYPEDDSDHPQLYLPPGIIHGRDLAKIATVEHARIDEYVAHSWYDYSVGDDKGLNPFKGETVPNYTGPSPPFERLDVAQKYSWLKSPRYDGAPMEVGPLARMLVAYASGRPGRVKQLVDKALSTLGVGPTALFSTLGRIAARAIEAQVLVESMDKWVRGLADNMDRRDYRIQDNSRWEPGTWPDDCFGSGFHEAPRGSLGHWVHIKDGAIVNYQCVVPSTWNAGPRDAKGQPGPYEAALVGTPVAKPDQPLEILRTLHSFDPCMACAVHVVDPTKRELVRVRVA
jgi:[NiFe] hydrogenase large subunit/hydrogenase large subunit